MIQITKVNPLDNSFQSKSLEDIEKTYLHKSKLYTSPYKYLKKLIDGESIELNGRAAKKLDEFDDDQENYLRQLYIDYADLITGKPDVLEAFINSYDESIIGEIKTRKGFGGNYFKLNEFGNYIFDLFGYDKSFRKQSSKGIWYAKELNIKACPYCNSQYTLVVSKDSTNYQAKFQFDHFFSKRRFPYLSISMYNLIPSCASCNLAKGSREFSLNDHFHPFHSDLDDKSEFRTKYALDISALTIGDTKKLPLEVCFQSSNPVYDAYVKTHDKIYNISGIYERFSDDARMLLNRAIVNGKSDKKSKMEIKGLFPDDKTYYEYILGTLPFKENIPEKPLVKFTRDLGCQFRLLPESTDPKMKCKYKTTK